MPVDLAPSFARKPGEAEQSFVKLVEGFASSNLSLFEFTQSLSAYADARHWDHQEMTVTFSLFLPPSTRPGLANAKISLRYRKMEPNDRGSERLHSVQWTSLWWLDDIRSEEPGRSLKVTSSHLMASNNISFPQPGFAYDRNPRLTTQELILRFASTHPIFAFHLDLMKHWQHSLDSKNVRLHDLLVSAFQICESKPSANGLQGLELDPGYYLVPKKGRRRTSNDLPGVWYRPNASLNRSEYEQIKRNQDARKTPISRIWQSVYIAIGSNEGDSIALIEAACDRMVQRGIIVKRTSALYETAPMYFKGQRRFLNAVCEVIL